MNSSNFRTITPYTPGAQPRFEGMIKLNTNENPYPPSPRAILAEKESETDSLRLYPPVDAGELRRAIAKYHGVEAEKVFVGVGSDDVLSVIFQACFNSGKPLLFPDISYSFYEVWAKLYGINYRMIPLRDDFTIDVKDYRTENGGIVIANPNAPTAMALGLSEVEELIAANPDRVVVIDEAYVDFGGQTALPLLAKYDNAVVVRTYSKSRSMAGLRIGYAIASPEIIRELETLKFAVNSYTMNRPSIAIGTAVLEDEEYFRETTGRIIATRERMTKELEKLGFTVLPSSANFVFAAHSKVTAQVIFKALEDRHIFVRYFNKPRIDNYLRISVGTDEQVDSLLEALKAVVL